MSTLTRITLQFFKIWSLLESGQMHWSRHACCCSFLSALRRAAATCCGQPVPGVHLGSPWLLGFRRWPCYSLLALRWNHQLLQALQQYPTTSPTYTSRKKRLPCFTSSLQMLCNAIDIHICCTYYCVGNAFTLILSNAFLKEARQESPADQTTVSMNECSNMHIHVRHG